MWTIAIAAVCLAVASASPVKTHLHVVSRLEQVAAEINAKETTYGGLFRFSCYSSLSADGRPESTPAS